MPQFKKMPQAPSQMWLMPPSLDEMVAQDDEVRVLSEAMDRLDWRILEATYFERGSPAYPPQVMTKVLVYAYSRGIRSSRRIEELVRSDVRYMWLAGMLKPDFHTIARFRKEKFSALSELFADSVRLCKELGLVNLNIAAIDGSKVVADASRKSLYNHKRLDKELEAVREILREAEAVDELEDGEHGDGNGREVPEELRDAKSRKAILDDLAKKLAYSGKKTISSTDNECRMMRTRDGIRPSFNVQAAVDSANQVVLAMKVTNSENDHGQLAEMIGEVRANCGMAPVMALADTGYCDEATLQAIEESGQESLVALKEHPRNSDANDLFSSGCLLGDDKGDVLVCPAGRELSYAGEHRLGSGTYRLYRAKGCSSCSFRKQCVRTGSNRSVRVSCIDSLRRKMKKKLASPGGRLVYALRKHIVEPVFGQLKHNQHFRRFLLRGMEGASSEMALLLLGHNLKKAAIGLA